MVKKKESVEQTVRNIRRKTRGQFRISEGSGHNIPIENPAVIIAALHEIMEAY